MYWELGGKHWSFIRLQFLPSEATALLVESFRLRLNDVQITVNLDSSLCAELDHKFFAADHKFFTTSSADNLARLHSLLRPYCNRIMEDIRKVTILNYGVHIEKNLRSRFRIIRIAFSMWNCNKEDRDPKPEPQWWTFITSSVEK